jgi:ribosomal protein L11 methyltransferase
MKHGALYISSGILDVKEKDVTDACRAQGLEIVEITRQGEWVSVTARRN